MRTKTLTALFATGTLMILSVGVARADLLNYLMSHPPKAAYLNDGPAKGPSARPDRSAGYADGRSSDETVARRNVVITPDGVAPSRTVAPDRRPQRVEAARPRVAAAASRPSSNDFPALRVAQYNNSAAAPARAGAQPAQRTRARRAQPVVQQPQPPAQRSPQTNANAWAAYNQAYYQQYAQPNYYGGYEYSGGYAQQQRRSVASSAANCAPGRM